MPVDTAARTDGSTTAPRTRPFTGAEYLESLRDGREIWIYGERVKDVTTHPAFRNTARMIARLYDALHDPAHQADPDHRDRHRQRRLHAQVLQGRPQRRGAGRRPRRHRRVGARQLRLDRPQPRLQGGVPRHARRQFRLLRALRGQRQTLVQEGPGGGLLRQPRHRQSAGRPRQAARRGERRLHARREGDRRRADRQRRQGGGDHLEPDASTTSSPTTARCRSRPSRSPSSASCRPTRPA